MDDNELRRLAKWGSKFLNDVHIEYRGDSENDFKAFWSALRSEVEGEWEVIDKFEVSYCENCRFFREQQSATESGARCSLGMAPSDKEGCMTVSKSEFGCIVWKELVSNG